MLPNLWLTLVGHTSANSLFLVLLVAWLMGLLASLDEADLSR